MDEGPAGDEDLPECAQNESCSFAERKVIMATGNRLMLLIVGLALMVVLAGCPGFPGTPGASGAGGQQNVPPGLQPPPGEKSGGARTLMGTTITPPEDAYLLIRYGYGGAAENAKWQSCRRVIPLENAVIIEGLNHDGRDKAAEKDVNQLLPMPGLMFFWKYELKPTPPPQPKGRAGGRGGRPGEAGPAGPAGQPPNRGR